MAAVFVYRLRRAREVGGRIPNDGGQKTEGSGQKSEVSACGNREDRFCVARRVLPGIRLLCVTAFRKNRRYSRILRIMTSP